MKEVNIYSFNDECYMCLGDYKKLQQENQSLKKANKIPRENAEHNDKLVDDYWWENKHYKHIIDELEKWLEEEKPTEDMNENFIMIRLSDLKNKLQELKGGVI